MGARRENGAPSAHTVLEVADGLRWTDPVLGVSLAEHARRLAGDDDPATRSAAERSILRSLAEADRYDDVVHRAGPLLEEARQRGDRDAAAAVVVELASAAMGLGDGSAAWTLVDRLRSVDELPARVAAVAALVRTRVRADHGDVTGTDGEAEQAESALRRVPEPEGGLVRREMTVARGRARRRAGDRVGALAVLTTAVTDDLHDDPDGGRRSLAAAAEQIELLVELGRIDEARARAGGLVPPGPVEPALLRAASRIRLALAQGGGADGAETRATAQALEDLGHLDDAARGWQVVAAAAEARGDLGEALATLRHGHALESRARDEHERSLRRLAAVDVGDLVAMGPAPVAAPPETAPPLVEVGPAVVETGTTMAQAVSPAVETEPPVVGSPSSDVLESLPRRRGHHRDEETSSEAAPTLPDPPSAADSAPAPAPVRADDDRAGLGRRDELADLLAALSRSMEQLPVPALGASADAGATGPHREEPGSMFSSLMDASPSVGDPSTNGGWREESRRERSALTDEPAPTSGRRSRHSASDEGSPSDGEGAPGSPSATRPTFDAFSTAPLLPPEGLAPTSDRQTSEHAASGGSFSEPVSSEPPAPTEPPVSSEPPVPTEPPALSALPEPPVAVDRFTPVPETAEPDRSLEARYGAEPVSLPSAVPPSADPLGESRPSGDELAPTDRGRESSLSPSPSSRDDRPQEPRPSRASGRPRPTPREDSSRGHREARSATGRPESSEDMGGRAPRGSNGTATPDELQEDLGLTLASVLGEYDLPDVPMPPRTDRQRSSADVAVPSARRHTSGSMPVPAEGRRDPREGAAEPQAPAAARPAAANGRARPAESGPRLADLLAEAMDAFRHAGPAAQDDARPPGVGSRRA